jgi:hypothetical protein
MEQKAAQLFGTCKSYSASAALQECLKVWLFQVDELHAGQSSRENPIVRTITMRNFGSEVAKYSISHSPSLAVNFSYIVAEQHEVGVGGQHLELPPPCLLP